jgi:hypothetical protein
MKASNGRDFAQNYASHLQHLKLKGLRPTGCTAMDR